jgi:hypothetical protein
MDKFKNNAKDMTLNPVEWFNFYGDFKEIFKNSKNHYFISDTEVGTYKKKQEVIFSLKDIFVTIKDDDHFDIPSGAKYTKFMLLTKVRYKNNYSVAMNFVLFDLMKIQIPFIRVGVDYYKKITKPTRYGGNAVLLKHWRKEEIKQDYDANFLNKIYKYDDFTIEPNNVDYSATINSFYNLYSKFQHEIHFDLVKESEIETSLNLIEHIFGNKYEIGLRYLKVLFEYPKQILPIVVLVSEERGTGKTTFLNWMDMIFGENCVSISPDDVARGFNSIYATKNIILIDEAVAEKQATVEKLKSIATAKTISVSQKFVSEYSIPFYGKIILCTNKETDFMKIDNEEIRFFVLKVPTIQKLNTQIETLLFNEIPKFLKYLTQLSDIDFSLSRMVFTADEIKSDALEIVKEESKSGLCKEIDIIVEDYFNNNAKIDEFQATPLDIKNRFFSRDNSISANYIRKVLKNEFKLNPDKIQRYNPFNDTLTSQTGTPFTFKRIHFCDFVKNFFNAEFVDF